MKYTILVISLTLTAALISSCYIRVKENKLEEKIKGIDEEYLEGEVIEAGELDFDFSEVVISGAANVKLVRTDKPFVSIDRINLKKAKVELRNNQNTLCVYVNAKNKKEYAHLTVGYKTLESVSVSGASEAEIDDVMVSSENFIIKASGAADVKFRSIKGGNVVISASGASEVEGKTVEGVHNFTVNCTGSPDVDIENINAENVSASASGSSDIELEVYCDNLYLYASGSSDLKVKGELSKGAPAIQKTGSSDIDLKYLKIN